MLKLSNSLKIVTSIITSLFPCFKKVGTRKCSLGLLAIRCSPSSFFFLSLERKEISYWQISVVRQSEKLFKVPSAINLSTIPSTHKKMESEILNTEIYPDEI